MKYEDGKLTLTERETFLAERYLGNNVDWLDSCYEMFNSTPWMARVETNMLEMGASDEDIRKDADGLMDLIAQGHEAYIQRKQTIL